MYSNANFNFVLSSITQFIDVNCRVLFVGAIKYLCGWRIMPFETIWGYVLFGENVYLRTRIFHFRLFYIL
jgi:hypothetical protein